MKFACRYAIVRFMPYPETGEFANVGVVLMSPNARFFSYRFIERRVARINAFFEELKPDVYRKAQDIFEQELARIRSAVELRFAGFDQSSTETKYLNMLFDEMTRPRESIMYLDDPRVVLADDPAQMLGQLYERYVSRSFVNTVSHEKELEHRIKEVLIAARLDPMFHEQMLRNDYVQARFPFVRMDNTDQVTRVIKPLNLNQSDATKLYKYGSEWVAKVRSLRNAKKLPNDVLFAVEGPDQQFGTAASAYAEIMAELERIDIQVASPYEKSAILSFAKH